MVRVFFNMIGFGGGILSLYGYYTQNTRYWVIGLIICFLLCSVIDAEIDMQIAIRVLYPLMFGSIGMLICHFLLKMTWGLGLLISVNWILVIEALFCVLFAWADRH